MNNMIKSEREKIFSRKSFKVLFIVGIFIIAVYFYFFQFSYQTLSYNYESNKIDFVSGFSAIEQRKNIAELFEGDLTQETLEKMEKELNSAIAATIGRDENSVFSATYIYRDQAAILEYMINDDGTAKQIDSAYSNNNSIVLGYCDGWNKMLSSMGSILPLMMCLIISICISPVFAEEYAYHTDSVICSSRFGKSKLITAKIIASIQMVIAVYLLFVGVHLVLYGIVYGLEGWNVSIQSSLRYVASIYSMTFIKMFLISIVLNILGIVTLTIITLYFSSKMGSPVSALILSCTVCFLPVIFDFTENLPLLQMLQEICPIFMLHSNRVFAKIYEYMGTMQPIIMIIFNVALLIIFYIFTKKSFKNHQVTA